MGSELVTPQTFEQKMMDRIRDSVGELLSDEDLKKIIERGVEKALFQPREVKDRYYNTRLDPSLVDIAVEKFLSARVSTAVDKWIAENPDRLQKAVDDAVVLGVAGCVDRAMETRFSWVFDALKAKTDEINGRLTSRGL